MASTERMEIKIRNLKKQYETEREKVNAYGQIVKMYSAYIGLLLQKLGATKENAAKVSHGDIKKAMAELETRALPTEDGFELYVEVIGDELNISAEASGTTREATD